MSAGRGRLLITDYALSDPAVKPHSQGLLEYLANRRQS